MQCVEYKSSPRDASRAGSAATAKLQNIPNSTIRISTDFLVIAFSRKRCEAVQYRLRLRERCSFPFKGKVGIGMGHCFWRKIDYCCESPIPTPALPLKGREQIRPPLEGKGGCRRGLRIVLARMQSFHLRNHGRWPGKSDPRPATPGRGV